MTWTHVALLQLLAIYVFFSQYWAWLQPRRVRITFSVGNPPGGLR